MNKKQTDMLHGPLFSSIVSYTIPIILSGILQLLFNAADLVVVGQFCGSISVGAVSATAAITNLIINLFVGLSVGAGVCVAHGLGSKQDDIVHRTVHTAIPISIISGIILTVVGVCLSRPLLEMMSTPENVLPLSSTYMTIYFWGITFTILYNFGSSILRAAGDTKNPLIYLIIAGILNVILNVIFVVAFDMNVAGVALATIISQAVSAFLVIMALMKRTDACKFYLKKMHIYKDQLLKMIRIGLPAGVQGTLFSISNVIIQSSINGFGIDALIAGNGAASSLEGFIYAAVNAFSQTSVNFIGQNMGAQQFHRIRRIFGICAGCVTVVGVVLGLGTYFASPFLLTFYITDSAEALSYGIMRLAYISLPYCFCGLMDMATGALRGLGASFVPMLVTILGVCGLRIGWVYTIFQIPQYHTPESLYISYIVSWVVTFLIQMVLFLLLFHKREKQAKQGTYVPTI